MEKVRWIDLVFVGTMVQTLTFALGRGIEPSDAPAIRKILLEAEKMTFDSFRDTVHHPSQPSI